MPRTLALALLTLILLAAPGVPLPAHAYLAAGDKPIERDGARDPAFLPRRAEAVATEQIRRDFAEYQLPTAWDEAAGDWKTRAIDGRFTQTYYDHDARTSVAAVLGWYTGNLKKHGFRIEFEHRFADGTRRLVASLARSGPVSVDLELRPAAEGVQITVTIVDGRAAEPRPELEAQPMLVELTRNGRVVLHDLRFEPDGQVAPESALQLDEVARILTLDRKLKVRLEAYSDEAGQPAKNLARSKKQAAALRAWLGKHHKALAARVVAVGAGDVRPAGDESGAVRRVEIVRVGDKTMEKPNDQASRHGPTGNPAQ